MSNKFQRYSRDKHGDMLGGFLSAFDDDDLPDGAWWAMLEEGAVAFSKEYKVKIDPNDAVHEYLKLRNPAK